MNNQQRTKDGSGQKGRLDCVYRGGERDAANANVDGADGDVMSPTEKAEKAEKAEHKALQNNFYQEVSAGDVTLTFRDFVYSHNGEPAYVHIFGKDCSLDRARNTR